MTNLLKHLDKINSELDMSIESSNNIIEELSEQDKKINQITMITETVEEKVTWSEYLLNIINTYFGFIWRKTPIFLYKNKSNDVDTEVDNDNNDDDDENIKDISEDDNDFFDKINKVRQNGEKIGDIIDKQNDKLTTQLDTIDKINDKINEVLINQINV
jgi:hypothetical protein